MTKPLLVLVALATVMVAALPPAAADAQFQVTEIDPPDGAELDVPPEFVHRFQGGESTQPAECVLLIDKGQYDFGGPERRCLMKPRTPRPPTPLRNRSTRPLPPRANTLPLPSLPAVDSPSPSGGRGILP